MFSSGKKLIRTLLVLGVVTILLIGASGVFNFGMTMTMDKDGNMTMSDCFMPGMSTICNMSSLEHVAMWQSMLTSIPNEINQILALLLLLVSGLGIMWITYRYPPPRVLFKEHRYYSYRTHASVITALQELFSSGILNPKLF